MSAETTISFVQELKTNEELRSAVKQEGLAKVAATSGYDVTSTNVKRLVKEEIMDDIPSTELPSEDAVHRMSNGPCSPSCGSC